MPPPQMTTSAVSILTQAPELEDELERGERADVAVVERRRQLHEVEPDEVRYLGDSVEHLERLAGGEATGGRDLGPGRECRIERIDVERDMHVRACERRRHLLHGSLEIGGELARAEQGDAVVADELQ